MPSNKEIEITLSLKDEATKKIQSFRSSVKEFSSATKDTLAPVLQLRQAWMKTSLAIGAVTGAVALGISEINKLGEEIDKFDKLAIKTGISTAQLSNQIYGFNIATDESRIGVYAVKQAQTEWQKLLVIIRKTMAEGIGQSAIGSRSNVIAARSQKNNWGSTITDIAKLNPLLAVFNQFSTGGNISKYGEQAKQELLDLAQKQKEVEALKNGIVAEAVQKTNQLTQSGYAYKIQLLNDEVAAYKATGVDKITLSNYEAAARKRIEEDYTLEVKNQQATILEAESNTLGALRIKQEAALAAYKRQWGDDGEAVSAFIRGQEAIYKKAQYTYLGIKENADIIHDAYLSAVNGMTVAMASFYDTTTGEFKSLAEIVQNFGNVMINVIQQMIASMLVAKAAAGIATLFAGSTITGGVGGTTSQTSQFGTVWSPYHAGGIIRAHSGLAVDEVPIIAQTGERVLSRSQNREYERGISKSIDSGVINNYYTFHINATDPKSFEEMCRNRPGGIIDVAKGTILGDLRTNGSISQSIRNR